MSKEAIIQVYIMRVDYSSGKQYKGVLGKIPNTLSALQAYVSGLIECIGLGELDIIMNEEGKLMHLPHNRAFVNELGVLDVIVGNILVCRHDEDGNFTSILPEDIPIIEKSLKPCQIIKVNDESVIKILDANMLEE